jgi:TolB-like protein
MDVYCAGVTDEVINALVSVPHLDVVARTSTFQFRDERVDVRLVGAELGADLILEGSIKLEGEHTRITSQLADAKDGFALWSGCYSGAGLAGEGELSQASIAEQIVGSLPFPSETSPCGSKKIREEV